MVVVVGETAFVPKVEVFVVHGAAQDAALIDDHTSVDEAPETIEPGLAMMATVGTGLDVGGAVQSAVLTVTDADGEYIYVPYSAPSFLASTP